jgi:hypothetical protein
MAVVENRFPPGRDEKKIKGVLAHYENQTEEEAVKEDDAACESEETWRFRRSFCRQSVGSLQRMPECFAGREGYPDRMPVSLVKRLYGKTSGTGNGVRRTHCRRRLIARITPVS